MVVTSSTMLPLRTMAPSFSLPEPATGRTVKLTDIRKDNGMLVMFLSNHCPFVKLIMPFLSTLASKLEENSIGLVGINSNDVSSYPEDSPEKMAELVKDKGLNFPYLFDETQAVAKAYSAACTPDFFLFDKNGVLAYRGQLDDARPGNDKDVTGKDILSAVEKMVSGEEIPESSMRPSMGCNIKWLRGNEPQYFHQ